MPTDTVKLAIISHSLGGGGAERTAALLSRMLSSEGLEIHNIIVNDRVDYEFGGTLYNLGKEANSGSSFYRKWKKARLLNRYLTENRIDCIIDHRARNSFIREFIYSKIYGNRKKIFVVHSHNLLAYFPSSGMLAKILYSDSTLVAVSHAIRQKIRQIYGLESVVIQNPAIPFSNSASRQKVDGKYILYFGRLDDQVKNFGLMLQAFSLSELYRDGIRLVIMGDGPDGEFIRRKSEELGIDSSVILLPFEENPSSMIKNAMFTILTSRFEGFPMSLIESLSMGTPVVSVDCESGPSEIIKNRENGLLVVNHNASELAESMKIFASDVELYQICKKNSAQSVAHLSVENMLKLWKQILPHPE